MLGFKIYLKSPKIADETVTIKWPDSDWSLPAWARVHNYKTTGYYSTGLTSQITQCMQYIVGISSF